MDDDKVTIRYVQGTMTFTVAMHDLEGIAKNARHPSIKKYVKLFKNQLKNLADLVINQNVTECKEKEAEDLRLEKE